MDELSRLRRYREIMETAHSMRLAAVERMLEHFDADGELIGDGRWRLRELFKCCQQVAEASRLAAERFDQLDREDHGRFDSKD